MVDTKRPTRYQYSNTARIDNFASFLFVRTSKKQEDASENFVVSNTPNGPLSSGLVPEVLNNQVMYNPSARPMERALIGGELVNNDDNDSLSDDNCFSPTNNEDDEEQIDSEIPSSLSGDREGNNISVDDSPPDANATIMTPNTGRHVSDALKVKIKLMKIMRNHRIPLVAEKEFTIADYGIYDQMQEMFDEYGTMLTVNTAFKVRLLNYLIQSLQSDPVGAEALVLNHEATSLQQLSEWGMQMNQGQFPQLKDRLLSKVFGDQKVILNVMMLVYNYQTSTAGHNQKLNDFIHKKEGLHLCQQANQGGSQLF
eukprot:jgi/Psemu1/20435/gm1.20435_g